MRSLALIAAIVSQPRVDNPVRTAQYVASCDARQAALRGELAELLRDQTGITLEIGCGHGHFLTAYAGAHAGSFCVGIDIIIDRVLRAGRKQARAGHGHLAFIRAEAGEFLAALPAHVFFKEIFVLFPDPWPKRRHHKNRLMQPAFLSALAAKSSKGARLCFRTDYAPYFADAGNIIAGHADWQIAPNAPWPFEHETVFQERAEAYQSLIAFRV